MNLQKISRAGIRTADWYQYDGDIEDIPVMKNYEVALLPEDSENYFNIWKVDGTDQLKEKCQTMSEQCGILDKVFIIAKRAYKTTFDYAYNTALEECPAEYHAIIMQIIDAFSNTEPDNIFCLAMEESGEVLVAGVRSNVSI